VTIITALTLHPDLAQLHQSDSVVSTYLGLTTADTNQTVSSNISSSWIMDSTWDCDDKFLGLLLTIGSSLLTISLLYGTITGRPRYILPFFWLQMFDFCVTSLTVIGYFSYGPDIKRWLAVQTSFPFRDELLTVGREWLLVIAAFLAMILLWTKAYCIRVVWSCYKFLIYRLTSPLSELNVETPVILHQEDGGTGLGCETQMILPPKYEDLSPIMTSTDSSTIPPPAYDTLILHDDMSRGACSAVAPAPLHDDNNK